MMWLILTACSEYSLEIPPDRSLEGTPEILVTPTALDFGSLSVGMRSSLRVTVQNIGTGLLTVDAPTVSGDTDGSFWTESPSLGLAASESAIVEVSFSPATPFAYSATMPLTSNDPLTPVVEVSLDGLGLGPWLAITPAEQDLGTMTASCGDEADFILQNVGSASLVLEEVSLDGDAQWSLLTAPSLPLSLTPGAYTTVTVYMEPTTAGETTATLTARSDGDQGPVTATAHATVDNIETVEDTFIGGEPGPVDILFAVDQSCSMDDDAAVLGKNFSLFIDTLQDGTTDWHLGVVTYDTGCLNGGVLTADTPNLETVFADAVVEGEDREIQDDEALLQLASRALSLSQTGECNEGFARPDTATHVIVISDEPERSTEQASAWTWEYWQDEMETLTTPLIVSGVIDTDDCNEGSDGYAEIIDATGGEALSICDGNWSDYARTLADASLYWLYALPLSGTPIPDTITVSVNGTPLNSGWRYEDDDNTVYLDEAEEGATITVRYTEAAECP